MHAMHVLHLFSTSFLITDHQNILFSALIFVEPRCPKYILSTTCFFRSSGITIFSPANSKPNRSVMSLKTEENFFGAFSFYLFLTHVFCFSHLGSTEVLCNRVFDSIIKLNSTSFIIFGSGVLHFRLFNHMADLNTVNRLFSDIIIL